MRALLVALPLLAASGSAAAAAEPPLLPPPRIDGPRRDGLVLGIDLGLGGCPDCPLGGDGGSFGLRLGWRLPVGLAFSGCFLLVGLNGEDCDDYYSCTERQYDVTFLEAEARLYPFSRTPLRFDPYLAVGLGMASAGFRDEESDATGFALVPRLGALAVLSDHFSLGGSVGRTFASWDGEADPGDSWFTGIELGIRLWGPG